MINTYLTEFAKAWNVFIRIPLPRFLSGNGESAFPEIDGHPALLRPMMPLIGAVQGLALALLFWAAAWLPGGRLTAALFGGVAAPLVMELLTGWHGLNALASYCELRRRGASREEAFLTPPPPMTAPRSAPAMILVLTIYLARMVLFGVAAYFAPFWFVPALTASWLVRADLGTLESPDRPGRPWLAVPSGCEQRHWHAALCVMLPAGILHPVAVLLAFALAWGMAWIAKNICLDTISGINRQAFAVFGCGAEMILLFLGGLLFAAP